MITWVCLLRPEFLKGATVRPRKVFQRLRKIWSFERKTAELTNVIPFLGHFKKMLVFGSFCWRKTFKQKYWLRNKIAFRKSDWDGTEKLKDTDILSKSVRYKHACMDTSLTIIVHYAFSSKNNCIKQFIVYVSPIRKITIYFEFKLNCCVHKKGC